ncbi:MAG: nuclease-related domain-containing protein [Kiritimatiellia bacterium]
MRLYQRMTISPKSFARVSGSPGTNARVAGALRVLTPVVALLSVTGVCLGLALPVPRIPTPYNAFLLIICAAGIVATVRWGRERLNNYLVGAQGEEVAGRTLALLPNPYRVYHGVPIGLSRDLDHVVCGPTGLWVIETTAREGRVSVRGTEILVDGEPMTFSPVEKARRASEELREALRRRAGVAPEVRAAVCFSGGGLSPDPATVEGVALTTPDSLCRLLTRPGEPLNEGVMLRSAAAIDLMLSGEHS